MKDNILTLIIGILIGAILATGGFIIYTKTNNTHKRPEFGTPPQMNQTQDSNQNSNQNNNTPPELPNNAEPNTNNNNNGNSGNNGIFENRQNENHPQSKSNLKRNRKNHFM